MPPTQRKSGYQPGFDGWRAIAILGVVMTHDTVWSLAGHTNKSYRGYGGYGVYLFFAISGILISWRILEDEAVLGAFHVRDFYVRRFFRIQPAAWAYLAVLALLMLLGLVHERWHFWLGALFLYQNFTWHSAQFERMLRQGWFTGHFWTLAVEEHFYILLSIFFLCCKRHRIALLTCLLALLFAWQIWARAHGLFSPDHSERRTYWVLPYLAVPALCAMLLRRKGVYNAAKKYLHPWVAFLFSVCSLVLCQTMIGGFRTVPHWSTLAISGPALLYSFSLWVIATMLHPESWTTRLLELDVLRYLGRLSYSFYLWHLLFFSVTTSYPGITWYPLVLLGQRPWRYLCALGVAMLSYHFLEKPMIRLGHKLAPPASPGHADLRAQPEHLATAVSRSPESQLYPVSK